MPMQGELELVVTEAVCIRRQRSCLICLGGECASARVREPCLRHSSSQSVRMIRGR